MGKVKVRYLVAKAQKSRTLYYWQPSAKLRAAGFMTRRLAEKTNSLADAVVEAERLNAEVDNWRAGRKPEPVPHGSLPWLVRLYRTDPRYTDRAPKTRRFYDEGIKRLERWSHDAGNPLIGTINRQAVKARNVGSRRRAGTRRARSWASSGGCSSSRSTRA